MLILFVLMLAFMVCVPVESFLPTKRTNPATFISRRTFISPQTTACMTTGKSLQLSAQTDSTVEEDSRLSRWFNPNTRGGVLVWSALLLIIPFVAYEYLVSTGIEETKVGAYVGAIFVLVSNLLWASTYIFRVATKDMTYATQLRDYENAVLQKRLDELADDEITALLEVSRDALFASNKSMCIIDLSPIIIITTGD